MTKPQFERLLAFLSLSLTPEELKVSKVGIEKGREREVRRESGRETLPFPPLTAGGT